MSTSPAPYVSTVLPDEVDVIVVGSGAAALTGAFTAASRGLKVLMLEKSSYLGGTAAYAGTAVWFPGNHVLERAGVEDSVEKGLTYFRATVGDRTPAELQEAYLRVGPELVRFLEDEDAALFEHTQFPDYFEAPGRARGDGRAILPVPIESATLGEALGILRPIGAIDKFGQDAPRDVLHGGQAMVGRFILALDRTGNADIRLECPMESLLTEGDAVIGVRAAGRTIKARRGVILAAGGFEGDQAKRDKYHGVGKADWTATPLANNAGDALDAAISVGAELDLLDVAWWAPAVLFPNGHASFLAIVRGGIMVGPDGRRFTNESLPYDQLGHAFADKLRRDGRDAELWWVFDSRTSDIPGYCEPVDLGDPSKRPVMVTADTLEDLAQEMGVPVASLKETVERFNGFAAEGKDLDFGRGVDEFDVYFSDGPGPNRALAMLEKGPFRAVRVVLSDLGTKGGPKIGANGQVLRPGGVPVPGLYAAGGSAASVAGHVYPGPGVPVGSGMAFGYLAIKDMLNHQ